MPVIQSETSHPLLLPSGQPVPRVPVFRVQYVDFHRNDGTTRNVMRASAVALFVACLDIVVWALFLRVLDTDPAETNPTTTHDRMIQAGLTPMRMSVLALFVLGLNCATVILFLDSFDRFRLLRRVRALVPFIANELEA